MISENDWTLDQTEARDVSIMEWVKTRWGGP
jgi:hypothetical protein